MSTGVRLTPAGEAQTAIDRVREAGRALGEARADEMRLEDMRPLVKRAAVLRIMQTPNDLTGKPHSASSAEAIVESDAVYMQHREHQRAQVIEVQTKWAEYEAARLEASLAVELAGAL